MLAILLFLGCGGSVQDFIPGTYVAEWKTEFASTHDTLVIETSGDSYQVERRTGFIFRGKQHYKVMHWVGLYDSNRKIIVINSNGRVLSFEPGKSILRMGTTVYQKL